VIEYEQPLACETAKAWPAIVKEPDRAASLLGATLNATDPFPFPLGVDVNVIHPVPVDAFHPQPSAVDTSTAGADPPDADAACEVALMR
jgi:hypothetical protein